MRYYLKEMLFAFIILTFQVSSCQEKRQTISFSELPNILNSGEHEDVIYIKNGTYNDISVTLKNKKPIKIIAEDPGWVILKGNTQLRLQSCDSLILSGFHFDRTFSQQLIKFNRVTNSIIENMFFEECKGSSPYSKIIGIQDGSRENIIRNNTFDGVQTMGVAIEDGNNIGNVITKNVFKNTESVKTIFPNSDGNGMAPILVGRWDSKPSELSTEISHNYFENIKSDGMEVICVKSNKNRITNNFFTNCIGGVSLRYGNNNLVSENVFIENGQNIRIFGDGHIIAENYIEANRFGIQLPAANYKKGEKERQTGYYQASNVQISGNVFKNMNTSNLAIGANERDGRRLLPSNVIYEIADTDADDVSGYSSLSGDTQQLKLKGDIKVQRLNVPKKSNSISINKTDYFHGKLW